MNEVLAAKEAAGVTVAVCLPALNEAATIGQICRIVTGELRATGVVDDLVVMDSGSSDATRDVAEAAGASVHVTADVLREAGPVAAAGKGESLWKSLVVVDSDIIVWLDSDTRNFAAHFVTRLLVPLLSDPAVSFAKAFYERPLHAPAHVAPNAGGRVTEIAIRPLINLLVPSLAGFIQPLSGEYAGRTALLRELPFAVGYDVDLLLLMDVVETWSLDSVVQVDLGERVHRNRDPASLGRMSFEITRGLLGRLDREGIIKLGAELPSELIQFRDDAPSPDTRGFVTINERRPPMSAYVT